MELLGAGFARFRRWEVVALFDGLSVCSLLDWKHEN
jgi:hypothetical protein